MPETLSDILRQKIRESGPMRLDEYMALCLSHPEHGYYMTRDPFGASGDFTTAPEISQLFGEMIGAWLADLWIRSGRPNPFTLLECGPGRGTLMADILRATKAVPGFNDAAQVALMEISPVLMAAQKAALHRYAPYWIGDISQVNPASPVFLIANEFLDALPVRQFVKRGVFWRERAVSLGANDAFEFVEISADDFDTSGFPDGAEGAIFETSPCLNQYMKCVLDLLKKQKAASLFIDYGHVKTACGETVQAMKNHRYAGIFDTPGSIDLTAHVDFENIVRMAKKDGLAVHGPITQRDFLRSLGIEQRAHLLCAGADRAQIEAIQSGLSRLIDTDKMGILFKVVALCHDALPAPEGFHEGV